MVAARGLREASVSEEGEIAITLLRSFGWLSRDDLATRNGGAGPQIQVPGGQSLGEHTFHLSLIPFAEDGRIQAEAFQTPMRAVGCSRTAGKLPSLASFLKLTPPEICISAVKLAEDGEGVIVRLLNLAEDSKQAFLETLLPLTAAWRVRMDESILSELQMDDPHQVRVELQAHEVLTLRLLFQQP